MSTAFSDEFSKNINKSLKDMNVNFENIFNSIKEAFFKMLIEMAAKAAVFGFLNFITGGAFGAVTKVLGFEKGGKVPKLQTGGEVSGPGGVDNVPAMLTAGEYVVNKKSSQLFAPLLDKINAIGLQGGGQVPGNNMSIEGDTLNITISGAENPEEFAGRLFNSYQERKRRYLGGSI
jgi:hypothetical protein